MWKTEFIRLFFDKKTIFITLGLIICGLLSFYVSYGERQVFIKVLAEGYADVDSTRMSELINNYNGIQFNLDFFLSSDLIEIYLIILFLYFGIFLSSSLQKMIDTGQESFILSRISYKKHIKSLLIAQSIYIAAIILISFIIIIISGFIIGGYGSGITEIGESEFGILKAILIISIQYLLITLFSILVNGISQLSNVRIKNRMVIQSLPFVLFMVVPMIVSSTIGNIIHSVGVITSSFVPFVVVKSIYYSLIQDNGFIFIVTLFIPFLIYFILLALISKKNINMFSKDYL